MDLELPERLHATRNLLMRSLATHPLETAPAMPDDLMSDLEARFSAKAATAAVAPTASWFEKLRLFVATPAFGAVAAAIVVIAVAIPMISGPDSSSAETFRGAETASSTAASVKIFFIGENAVLQRAIVSSGDFEASAFGKLSNRTSIEAATGPKVIIDFSKGTLSALRPDGSSAHEAILPKDEADFTAAVAAAVSHL